MFQQDVKKQIDHRALKEIQLLLLDINGQEKILPI